MSDKGKWQKVFDKYWQCHVLSTWRKQKYKRREQGGVRWSRFMAPHQTFWSHDYSLAQLSFQKMAHSQTGAQLSMKDVWADYRAANFFWSPSWRWPFFYISNIQIRQKGPRLNKQTNKQKNTPLLHFLLLNHSMCCSSVNISEVNYSSMFWPLASEHTLNYEQGTFLARWHP